jgi:hypothetical protein
MPPVIYDIFRAFADDSIPKDRRWYFLATLDHIYRIRQDASSITLDPMAIRVAHDMAVRFKAKPEQEMRNIIQLHERYALEWLAVLERAQSEYPLLKPIWMALNLQRKGCA